MSTEEKQVLMKADSVKVHFKVKNKKNSVVKAVDGVSFEIMKGETFGVVGESGCGKSTLGRTLVRLLTPTEGKIYLEDTEISSLKGNDLKNMRKNAQIIFQDPSASLNPSLVKLSVWHVRVIALVGSTVDVAHREAYEHIFCAMVFYYLIGVEL